MDNLKNLIENNRDSFVEKTMLDGDEKRFFDKLDKDNSIQLKSPLSRKKPSNWRVYVLSIAAVTMLLLACNIFVKSYLSQEDEISRIYRDYIVEVVDLCVDIENNIVMSNRYQRTIEAIIFEARPLMDILPEEMPREEKIRVVNEYYSKKLAGVERLRERLLEYN